MINYRSLSAICLFILIACSVSAQKVIPVDTSHVKVLRIDPANANGGAASDIFEQINFIPLETTPDSLFGSIWQLAVVDDYFIILDDNTNCILLFNKDGKFHAKIKGTAGGPKLWRFAVDKWNKRILYSTDDYQTINYCDFDGKFSKKINLDQSKLKATDFFSANFIAPDEIVSYSDYQEQDEKSKKYTPALWSVLRFINKDDLTSVAMPYSKWQTKIKMITPASGSQITDFGVDGVRYFSKTYENSIYTVTPNSVKLTYKLVFPAANLIPKDFTTNFADYPDHIQYLNKHTDLIYNLSNCYQMGDNLLFRADCIAPNKEDNLIYNLKSGNVIAYKHIGADDLSFMLPVYDDLGSIFNNVGLAACDGKFVYTSLSSLTMFTKRDENPDKKIKYNAVLADYFAKSTKKDNPVILQLKLKDEL